MHTLASDRNKPNESKWRSDPKSLLSSTLTFDTFLFWSRVGVEFKASTCWESALNLVVYTLMWGGPYCHLGFQWNYVANLLMSVSFGGTLCRETKDDTQVSGQEVLLITQLQWVSDFEGLRSTSWPQFWKFDRLALEFISPSDRNLWVICQELEACIWSASIGDWFEMGEKVFPNQNATQTCSQFFKWAT